MGCVSTGFAWCSQSRLTFKVWQIVPRTVTHLIQDLVGLLTLGNATEYAVGLQECIHSHKRDLSKTSLSESAEGRSINTYQLLSRDCWHQRMSSSHKSTIDGLGN